MNMRLTPSLAGLVLLAACATAPPAPDAATASRRRAGACGSLDDHGIDDLTLTWGEDEKLFIQSRPEPQYGFIQGKQAAC